MSDVVVRADGLGKRYLIGRRVERQRYQTLRDGLARATMQLARSAMDVARGKQLMVGDEVEDFWALKNVTFEIKRGEIVGIIGRNGSGKSTLLKILSRITEPSEGRAEVRGQVGSLLEVGTGFHPELTGRENIYLNGAILGMRNAEVRQKLDAIVSFAEIEQFLDTPVKRYSSGMYVRLAFAVAAHLEPDILVVDEVLAVGDAEFQRKCLGRLGEFSGGGRTVLLVSHNMAAVQTLCTSALLMSKGSLIAQGSTPSVIEAYALQANASKGASDEINVGGGVTIESLLVTPERAKTGSCAEITINLKSDAATRIRELALLFHTSSGQRAGIVDLRRYGMLPLQLSPDGAVVVVALESIPFIEGDYPIGIYIVSDRFAGNLLDIGTLSLQSAPRNDHWVPYPVQVRGVVELSAQASISARGTRKA